MPCFFAILALFLPRTVVVILFLFSTWFQGVFATMLWPVLGVLFTPTLLLWYSVVVNVLGGTWGVLEIAVGVIAVLIDLSPAAGGTS